MNEHEKISDRELRKNGEGYSDPTAYRAIKNVEGTVDPDEVRFRKLLAAIFNICELAGFHLEGRIEVTDKRTGKVWR